MGPRPDFGAYVEDDEYEHTTFQKLTSVTRVDGDGDIAPQRVVERVRDSARVTSEV